LPYTYRHHSEPEGTTVVLSITGDAGGDWTLLRESGSWNLYSGQAKDFSSRVTMNQELAWRLFTNGVDRDFAQTQICMEGNQSLGREIPNMVSIMA